MTSVQLGGLSHLTDPYYPLSQITKQSRRVYMAPALLFPGSAERMSPTEARCMTSLHPDRLTTEGAAPTPGTRRTRSQASGKPSRTAAASASGSAPVKPRVAAPAARSTRATSRAWAAAESASRLTERAKVARGVAEKTAKVARTAGATAKAAGTKAAAAKPTAAKATTAQATAAKPAAPKSAPAMTATKAAPAKTTADKPAPAKAATAKRAAAKAATPERTAKPATTKAATSKVAAVDAASVEPAAVRRPTPYKRTEAPADAVAPAVAVLEATAAVDVELTGEPSARWWRGRRVPSVRRRPVLYLAAALVGALSISAASSGDTTAVAETSAVSQPVSVAEALGIEAETVRPIVSAETTDRLGDLVASRAERDEEQAQAARIQARADEEAREKAERAAKAAAEAARPKAVMPVEGTTLTSAFGPRWGSLHAGIDLAGPMRTPEYAAMDGVVLQAGPASGFGLAVYIQHENGDVTVYGHMDEVVVSAGQVVKAGETIALLGNTGQSTGPHLHFEVRQGGLNGTPVDPIGWLRARGVQV